MSNKNNYHSRLLDVSKTFDYVIQVLKANYVDEKLNQHWLVWLLLSPIRDLQRLKDLQNGIFQLINSSFVLALIPFISFGFGPILFYNEDIHIILLSVVSGILGYMFAVVFYFPMLINFTSDHFHLGAYKRFRTQEYNLFRSALLDNPDDFYFQGIYDQVTNDQNVYSLVDKRLGDYLHNEKAEYKGRIIELESRFQQIEDNTKSILEKYEEFIEYLIDERDSIIEEMEYLIQLMKDINMLLYRKFNGKLTLSDLKILTGYTIYEQQEDNLVLIEDVHTSGASPKVISLSDEKYSNYGAVQVIKNYEPLTPYKNEPYKGHNVVSLGLNMDNKAMWVFNFHFDDTDKKAWKLLVENGKIDSREVYRLIHALCLLSLEKYYFTEEAENK